MDWECCWDKSTVTTSDCPNIGEGEEDLLQSQQRRILEKCCDCDRFKHDLARFRDSGNPLAPVLALINTEYRHQKNQIQSLVSFLDNKTLEVRFLHELGSVLQSSVDLDEVLSVALTAITAGKGFGMNRAFLLLFDRNRNLLYGHLAIGPRNYDEAWQAWNEISTTDMDLQTLAQNFRHKKLTTERAKFQDILKQMTFTLDNSDHIFAKTMDSNQPALIEDAFHHPDVDPELARLLGVDTFLLMPLISRNRRVGLIIADNCITHRRISEEDMRSLETFTFPVAFAIERASLYDRLQVELNRVTEAGKKLKEQQEQIVKMEKMALVGRITSSIAHSIRNPLMIIGGFARSVLKNTPETDPKRDFIESIVGEARQMEGVLDEILSYSDALYPAKDFWNVNQMVTATISETSDRLQALGCEISFVPGESLPAIFIDYKQVAYCLKTMIMSAIDGHKGGRIDIRTYGDGDQVIMHVSDTSVRLSQEDLDRLLVPFSTTLELGSGLGLALCKTILDKQGIAFNIRLLPDTGIDYTISFPTRKEE